MVQAHQRSSHSTVERRQLSSLVLLRERIFSVSTLYYTCSYFHYAREVRFRRPFGGSRPSYGKALDPCLMRVTDAFSSDIRGIWDISQEVIGERFTSNGSSMTYAQMCVEHEADELFRRAPFFRPVDFYSNDLDDKLLPRIKDSLDELIVFLDGNDPQTYDPVTPLVS